MTLSGENLLRSEIAATVAELATIERALVDAPGVVAGSTGQDTGNPLFKEARAHRATLTALLAALSATESAQKSRRAPGNTVSTLTRLQDAARKAQPA